LSGSLGVGTSGCGGGRARSVSTEVVERQSDPLPGRHSDPPGADSVQRRRVERDVVDDVADVRCQRDGRSGQALGLVVGNHCGNKPHLACSKSLSHS